MKQVWEKILNILGFMAIAVLLLANAAAWILVIIGIITLIKP